MHFDVGCIARQFSPNMVLFFQSRLDSRLEYQDNTQHIKIDLNIEKLLTKHNEIQTQWGSDQNNTQNIKMNLNLKQRVR